MTPFHLLISYSKNLFAPMDGSLKELYHVTIFMVFLCPVKHGYFNGGATLVPGCIVYSETLKFGDTFQIQAVHISKFIMYKTCWRL